MAPMREAFKEEFGDSEPEPVKYIYKMALRRRELGARPFLDGAGAESWEPLKKVLAPQHCYNNHLNHNIRKYNSMQITKRSFKRKI